MPTSDQRPDRSAVAYVRELRELRETAEDIRAGLANLHGRLDVIEALLKQTIEHRGETGSSPDQAVR